MLFYIFFAPWQETFTDAGWGAIWDHVAPLWDHFRTILDPCWMHFRIPLCQQIMFFNQKYISLKWHILTSSPLFNKDHPSPYFALQMTKAYLPHFKISNISKVRTFQNILSFFGFVYNFRILDFCRI